MTNSNSMAEVTGHPVGIHKRESVGLMIPRGEAIWWGGDPGICVNSRAFYPGGSKPYRIHVTASHEAISHQVEAECV